MGFDINRKEVSKKCQEAIIYNFYSVYSAPYNAPLLVEELKGSKVKAGTGIDVPFGNTNRESKAAEAGADRIGTSSGAEIVTS